VRPKNPLLAVPRPRVIVVAYAAEPERGSEAGAGWGVVRALAKYADCTVLVGPENGQVVCDWQEQTGDPGLSFIEVPEPSWAHLAKWHRIPQFLVYLGWLRNVRRLADKLHARQPFDAAAHVSTSVYWLPSPATRLGIPCLWGPVGGAVTTPRSLWPVLGWRGLPGEFLDAICVRLMARMPWTRSTWRGATVPIIQNEETLAQLPESIRANASVLNHALFTEMPNIESRPRKSQIVYCAGLQNRKGPTLAIRSLATTPDDVRLLIVGEGPELKHVQRLAQELGIADRVEFRGPIPRIDLFNLLAESAAAVFTGLREEGGMALAEAMLTGTPVVALANGGARTIAETTTDRKRITLIEPGHVNETARHIGMAMTKFSRNPTSAADPTIDQLRAQSMLQERLAVALSSRYASCRTEVGQRRSSLSETV
jgi:hypothetical protein